MLSNWINFCAADMVSIQGVEAKPKQSRTKQISLKFSQSVAMHSVSSHVHSHECSSGGQCFLSPNLFA